MTPKDWCATLVKLGAHDPEDVMCIIVAVRKKGMNVIEMVGDHDSAMVVSSILGNLVHDPDSLHPGPNAIN